MGIALFPASQGWRKLDEQVGTGASGTLTFSGIPAHYRHLQVVVVGRSDSAVAQTGLRISFESSPTAGAYDYQLLRGNNATVTAAENAGSFDFIHGGSIAGASAAANVHSASIITIFEYSNTGIFKPAGVQGFGSSGVASGQLYVDAVSGLWESTAAIDTVRLTLAGGNWAASSRATLYASPR